MLEKDEFRQMLDGSQMVLAGLGEEFECSSYLKEQPRYMQILEELQEEQYIWILPYIQYLFLRDYRPLGKATFCSLPVCMVFWKILDLRQSVWCRPAEAGENCSAAWETVRV